MLEWVKEHPYLTGTAIIGLIILYFVWRGSSTSNQPASYTSGPSDAQLAAQVASNQTAAAYQANQDSLNAALQAKSIDANAAVLIAQEQTKTVSAQGESQLQQVLAAAGAQVRMQEIGQQAETTRTNAETSAAVAAIMGQVTGQVDIARINAGAGVDIAGIQAGVSKEQIAAQLAAQKDINAATLEMGRIKSTTDIVLGEQDVRKVESTNVTALGINAQNTNRDIAMHTIDLAIVQDTNQLMLRLGLDTNDKQLQAILGGFTRDVDIAKLEAATQQSWIEGNVNVINNQTAAERDIYQSWINTQGAVSLAQINLNQVNSQDLMQLIASGALNKGGEGGSNQVAALAALYHQPAIGVAAEQAAATNMGPWNSPFATLTGIGNLLSGVGTVGTGGAV
jgi:hypothetical protein